MNQILKITLRFICFTVFIFFLQSCLEMNAEIIIRKSHMEVELLYILDQQFIDFGRGFGTDDPWILPLTETDFRLKAIRTDGIKLLKYQSKQKSNGQESIFVKLQAENNDALKEYFDWDLYMNVKNNQGEFIVKYQPIGLTDPVVISQFEQLLHKGMLNLKIKAPSRIKYIEGGESSGKQAEFSIALYDLIVLEDQLLWKIQW